MHPLWTYLAGPWEARTWRQLAYHLASLPIAAVLFTYLVTMYSVGIALAIVWVGLFALIAAQASLRGIGAFERGLANGLLGAGIQAPAPRASLHAPGHTPTKTTTGRWVHDLVHDGHSWRVAAWIMMRIVVAPVGFAVAIVALVVPLSLIAAVLLSIGYQFDWITLVNIDDVQAHDVVDTVTFWVAVGSPVILLIAPMFAWAVRGYSVLTRMLARWALGPCEEELTAAATARAELAEEQVRIDQELHDSIGHMITMNIIQAGAGAHVFDSDPEFARQALRNIEDRGRAAMGELDRIIAAIRGDQPETRAPLPGIDDVARVVAESQGAGMTIDATVDPPAVPSAVGRAAFGIVREALTNAAKHAPGAPVTVRVVRDGDALGIDVTNGAVRVSSTGDAAAIDHRSGVRHGVAGMRDRVALLGGRSSIGPLPKGGYAVRALLPLDASLSTGADASSPWADLRE